MASVWWGYYTWFWGSSEAGDSLWVLRRNSYDQRPQGPINPSFLFCLLFCLYSHSIHSILPLFCQFCLCLCLMAPFPPFGYLPRQITLIHPISDFSYARYSIYCISLGPVQLSRNCPRPLSSSVGPVRGQRSHSAAAPARLLCMKSTTRLSVRGVSIFTTSSSSSYFHSIDSNVDSPPRLAFLSSVAQHPIDPFGFIFPF